MTSTAVFALIVGVGMIGQWSFSYLSKQIPELKTEPIRILFHIAAEMATAIALIIAGVGLLTGRGWGSSLYLIAAGMLLYTCIVSPGYFAQQGQWYWVLIFAVIIILAVMGIFTVI